VNILADFLRLNTKSYSQGYSPFQNFIHNPAIAKKINGDGAFARVRVFLRGATIDRQNPDGG